MEPAIVTKVLMNASAKTEFTIKQVRAVTAMLFKLLIDIL